MSNVNVDLMPACSTVFAIPELLELILTFCRPMDLYRLPIINRSWRSAIEGSLTIQRLLFKRPLAGTLSQDHAWLDSWGLSSFYESESKYAPDIDGLVSFCLHPLVAAIKTGELSDPKRALKMVLMRSKIPTKVRLYLKDPMFTDLAYLKVSEKTDCRSSWSDDLVCQPPAKRVVLRLMRQYACDVPISDPEIEGPRNSSELFYLSTIGHPKGVTLEMISRAVKSYVWRHHYPSVTYTEVELSLRFD